MTLSISTKPHREVVAEIRNLIKTGKASFFSTKVRDGDLVCLNDIFEAHIRARTDYSTVNSDYTMTNLIGTWSRLTRIILQMEEKYG